MKALFLMLAGGVCLALGVIGLLIPVFPTTPFVLLAAGCFCSSSPRLYSWLASTRHFGAYIRNHRTKAGVPMAIKLQSLAFLWIMLAISMFAIGKPMMTLVLALIGGAVSAHILLLKTKK